MGELPSYDELPVRGDAPPRSSWGVWGDRDLFGCLNLLTTECVLRGARCVRKGAVFALNWDMELPDPPLFGRPPFRHEVLGLPNNAGHDELLHGWNTQSSSQWDGFRHIRSRKHGFYSGVPDEDHGVHHWARRGIAGRAVLADVARWRECEGRPLKPNEADPIEIDDLTATVKAQGSPLQTGDVLLIRTGWLAWYRTLDEEGRAAYANAHASTGLRPGRATAAALWDMHVAAVAADNPALEVWPPGALASPEQFEAARDDPDEIVELFVHVGLLPLLGLPIGELFDLEALASDCAVDGVYECFLTSAPLNLWSGVASPPNALAIK